MTVLTIAENHDEILEPPKAPAATAEADLDRALAELRRQAGAWVDLPMVDRRAILAELIKDVAAEASNWASACCQAEGLDPLSDSAAEEWLAGPYLVLRFLRLLESSLGELAEGRNPRLPGPVRTLAHGRVSARVFPYSSYDRLFYPGVKGEVWMRPGVSRATLDATQARAYREKVPGRVCLVLGGGNVSSIAPLDLLDKLFVEKQVVLLKMHPVNAYLGPIFSRAFQTLIDWGFLRIVYGDAAVGAYLCAHPDVDTLHITGSDKTHDAIVFGSGAEGAARKARRDPQNAKPITSELGNVSAVIVVPGPWSDGDLLFHAESVAAMLTNNAGFNCNAARLLVLDPSWPLRRRFLYEIRNVLAVTPTRRAYYPGAAERCAAFRAAHPQADLIGDPAAGELPWVFVADVDPGAENDICLRQEAFCGLIAETALPAAGTADFLDRAVAFVNDKVWGSLNVTILIDPQSQRDKAIAPAFRRALADLRFGTIAINGWAAVGYGLGTTPWGAFPGHPAHDIESGSGVVHNALMFDQVEKSIIRMPFRAQPKPLWFASHQTALALAKKITDFEAEPSATKLPGIFWEALRG